ncbi:hypothetical protein LTR86_010505 [Recurvomyces mirabilis]|nr:hypothetical protein LTR86_010505 [Recurvomyces mirabilis]
MSSTVTTSPQAARCYLLELPTELRLTIYDHLLPKDIIHIPTFHQLSSIPAIAYTCSLLRSETLPLYFGRGLWGVTSFDDYLAGEVQTWIRIHLTVESSVHVTQMRALADRQHTNGCKVIFAASVNTKENAGQMVEVQPTHRRCKFKDWDNFAHEECKHEDSVAAADLTEALECLLEGWQYNLGELLRQDCEALKRCLKGNVAASA